MRSNGDYMFAQVAQLEGLSIEAARDIARNKRIFTVWYDELVFPGNLDEDFSHLVRSLNSGVRSKELLCKMLYYLAYEGGGVLFMDLVLHNLVEVSYSRLVELGLRFELADARAQTVEMLFERPVQGMVQLVSSAIASENEPYVLSEAKRLLGEHG